MAKTPEPVRLADYRPYPFDVEETRLHFDTGDGARAALAAIGDGDRPNDACEDAREVVDKGLGATPKNP